MKLPAAEGAEARPSLLIQTKLRPPAPSAGVLLRPRLVDALCAPGQPPVLRVCASPGAGKTTLLAQLRERLAGLGWLVGWLSLDREDDEPGLFFPYLVAALGGEDGVAREAACLLARDALASPRAVLAALINGLARSPVPVALILDDADALTAPPLLDALQTLVRYAPPAFRLILAGRGSPALPFATLAARGQLASIGEPELRFAADEARHYFEGFGGPLAESAVADAVWRTTEGWAAGMYLVALSVRDADDADALMAGIRRRAGEGVGAYLAENVLAGLAPAQVDLLLAAGPLDRFCPELCAAVGGEPDARRRLDELAGQNLFVKRLDDGWFRFHALFADYLKARLARDDPARLRHIQLAAARWCADAGLWQEAVRYALAGGDAPRAAAWAEACAMGLVQAGEIRTVTGWLALLPPALVAGSLRLRLAHAWALAFGLHLGEARDGVSGIEADLASGRLIAQAEPGELAAVKGLIAGLSDESEAAMAFGRQALDAAARADSWVAQIARSVILFGLHTASRFDEATDLAARSAPFEAGGCPLFGMVYRLSMSGLGHGIAGRLGEAAALLREALARAVAESGPRSAVAALPVGYLAEILYERGDLQALGEAMAGRAEVVAETSPLGACARFTVIAARLAVLRGDRGDALARLDAADRLGQQRRWLRMRALTLAEAARILWQGGDAAALRARVAALQPAMPAQPPRQVSSLMETWLAWREALALLALAEGRADAAVAELEALVAASREAGFHYRALQRRILLAQALDLAGRRPRAVAELAAVLPLAEQAGMVRSLADAGVDALLALARAAPAAGLPEPLSVRERSLLQLVMQGLSNKAIARAAGVTPETVKWHLSNIYAKLGVRSRTEAILRARQAGLLHLPPG
ncbi:LuxR C-terminal-related transcriptional regulator [Zoogloea sp.]|uniref:LuxR C-terminal-related transcriptional regulator n=1 Tax=Zoogloea sp. TaxID=49181 RepID=UPI0035B36C5E